MARRTRRVMVAGTFEILHHGHLALFRKAAKLGDLFVVVSRDANAEKAKRRRIIVPEKRRLEVVSCVRYVKQAVLGGKGSILEGVRKVMPNIIYLGPDQMPPAKLKKVLAYAGLRRIRVLQLGRRISGWKAGKLLRKILKTP